MTITKSTRIIVRACVAASLACLFSPVVESSDASIQVADKSSEAQLARYLGEALMPEAKAARVYYYQSHSCGMGEFVTFPRMSLHATRNNQVGEQGVRDIFSAHPDAVVKARGEKLIVVTIGTSPNSFLTTPIKSVSFSDFSRYNPFMAIAALMNNRAVQAAAIKNGLTQSPGILGGLMTPPLAGAPHLPRKLQHVTLDGALDRVAIVFNGVVVYSLCADRNGSKRIQVYFGAFHSGEHGEPARRGANLGEILNKSATIGRLNE